MNYEIITFKPDHAMAIIKRDEKKMLLPVDDIIRSYTIPGSEAMTVLVEGIPIACGGIINIQWGNGEAWLLVSNDFGKFLKTCYRGIKQYLPAMIRFGQFKRVQCHCFNITQSAIFEHLGFHFESISKRFGPQNQDVAVWYRLFPEEE